jgi:beta-glucosidase
MAGGSAYFVGPHYAITPYEGIVNKLGASVNIGYEPGCTNHRLLPILDPKWITPANGEAEHGFTVEYFNNGDLSGMPVWTTVFKSTKPFWPGNFSPKVDAKMFSARFTGNLTVPETGRYTLGLKSMGLSRLYINNTKIIDNWTKPVSADEKTYEIELTAGETYTIQVEYSKEEALMRPSFHLGCLPPIPKDSIARAAKLAAESNVALVFVGLSHEWESESYDRPDMELVGEQVALIEQVAAANKNTVVVLNTGSPISMNWLDQVAGVVQAWYPGQECGNAIADVLFGDINPSGKLTQTFPKCLENNPAYINYPGENGKVHYGEGIFVGYRYYEKKKITPLFPFGYGLSYTTFAYTNLRLSSTVVDPQEDIHVSVDVQNTGTRAGQEVVQLYVRDVQSRLVRPEKELKAFAKIALLPGETKTVTLTLNRESLAYYDDAARQWVAEAGEFEVLVGSSSQDICGTASVMLTTTSLFGGPAKTDPRFTLLTPLRQLVAHETARSMLERCLPDFMNSPYVSQTLDLSVEQMSRVAPDLFTNDVKQDIARELAQI